MICFQCDISSFFFNYTWFCCICPSFITYQVVADIKRTFSDAHYDVCRNFGSLNSIDRVIDWTLQCFILQNCDNLSVFNFTLFYLFMILHFMSGSYMLLKVLMLITCHYVFQGGQGNKTSDTPKSSTARGPVIQENGTESPPVTSIMEAKGKSILLDMENSDFYEDYELPSEGELQAPGWMGEYEDLGNGNEMPQPTPVHEKPVMPSPWDSKISPPPVKLSSAIDMRLELGLEMEAEQDLKMLEHLQVDAIAKALSTTVPLSRGTTEQPRRPSSRNGNSCLAERTLQSSFSKIFNSCNSPDVDIASLLDLWLKIRISCSSLKFDSSSLRNLLSYLVHQPKTSPQAQQLCLQVLTLVAEQQLKSCATPELLAFLSNEDLRDFLVKLLSQISSFGPHSISPSPKPVKAFLTSLQSAVQGHSDVKASLLFQELLLKTLLELCTKRYCICF